MRKPRPRLGQPFELLLCPEPSLPRFPSPRQIHLPDIWHKARGQVLGHLREVVTLAKPKVLQLLAAQDTC